MGTYQVLSFQDRVDLEVVEIREYSTFKDTIFRYKLV